MLTYLISKYCRNVGAYTTTNCAWDAIFSYVILRLEGVIIFFSKYPNRSEEVEGFYKQYLSIL